MRANKNEEHLVGLASCVLSRCHNQVRQVGSITLGYSKRVQLSIFETNSRELSHRAMDASPEEEEEEEENMHLFCRRRDVICLHECCGGDSAERWRAAVVTP